MHLLCLFYNIATEGFFAVVISMMFAFNYMKPCNWLVEVDLRLLCNSHACKLIAKRKNKAWRALVFFSSLYFKCFEEKKCKLNEKY